MTRLVMAMDDNRSGTISLMEFKDGLKGLGIDGLRKRAYMDLFRAIDTDASLGNPNL